MKIGILTFHCAHNYGAVLQAYGLQEYLRSQGHETYIIDYRPGYLTRNYKAFNIRFWMASTPREIVYKLRYEPFLWKHRILRGKAFDRFIRNRFDLHPYVRHTNFSDFDAIFLGSDQIWNKTITGQRYDEGFFGGNATCRVIAYAASMGCGTLSDKDRERLRQYLAPMTAIGVREESLKELLQPLSAKPVYTTIDPTLLAGTEMFEKIASPPASDRKYVLVYDLSPYKREVLEIARNVAEKIGARIVELDAYPLTGFSMRYKDQTASPEQYLGYFRHAAFVVTTSFHGTAFSLLFNRPFYTIKQDNPADLRALSLLEKVGLTDRFIPLGTVPGCNPVRYEKVEQHLASEVEKSRAFIDDALSSPIR